MWSKLKRKKKKDQKYRVLIFLLMKLVRRQDNKTLDVHSLNIE